MSVPKTADPVSCGTAGAADGRAASSLPLAWIRGPQACSGAGYGSSGQGEISEPDAFCSQSPEPGDEPAHAGPELDGSVLRSHGGVRPGDNQRLNGRILLSSVTFNSVCSFYITGNNLLWGFFFYIYTYIQELCESLEEGIRIERTCVQLVEQHSAAQDWLREQVKGFGPLRSDRHGLQGSINTLKVCIR